MYIDSFTDAAGNTTTYVGTSKEDVDAQKAAAQGQSQAAYDAYHEGQTLIQIGGGLQGNNGTGGDLPTEADLIGQSLTLQDPSTGGGGGDTSGGNGGNTGGGSSGTGGTSGSNKSSGGSSGSSGSSNSNSSSNSSSNTTSATTKVCNNGTCKYQMLAPITGLLGTNGVYTITQDSKSLCSLLNEWFRIGIALAGMLAVVMIVLGGFQYATTDSLFDKSEGKEKIQSALWGLLLALTTWLVLNTINPALVKCELNAPVTTLSKVVDTSQTSTQTLVNDTVMGGLAGMMVSRDGTLGVSTSGSGDNGSIAANAIAGTSFPNQSWNDQAEQAIKDSGILNLNPSDAAKFFPDGNVTAQGYVNLLASIAKSESGFNPNDNINHSQGTDVGNTYSVGLFSLTGTDRIVQQIKPGATDADLADPTLSINAAVAILKNQVQSTGSITGSASNHYWGPLYRGK
jgi:Transglycosylase SLT domain